jgi:hypothetical protein
MTTPAEDIERIEAELLAAYGDAELIPLARADVRRAAELAHLANEARATLLSGGTMNPADLLRMEEIAQAAREALRIPQRAIRKPQPLQVEFVRPPPSLEAQREQRRAAREAERMAEKDRRIAELEQQLSSAQRSDRDRPAPAPQPPERQLYRSAFMGAVPVPVGASHPVIDMVRDVHGGFSPLSAEAWRNNNS